ncbi:error-prone DNA polymerase [Paralimibaculum aggregatum]|uniref:Error-prone DNA polymerase n=1 Tax=Paralimibaculum aggregatum TaxID=3036245 RepID=A0ABQ6LM47_9RHOB|nr:error-prone DNA polymerase [Limibaculum sp. NKW23]GMG82762.1 error-prone DNA polymerase [Limibaculum sp. NKW23]
MTIYAELAATTNFCFLRGASHPEELVETAARLGLAGLGVADRNTLAGVVRAHVAARAAGLRLAVGCRLVLEDAPDLICYPEDRAAYGRLSRLLSRGKRAAEKGKCRLLLDDVIAHSEGQLFIAVPPPLPERDYPRLLARLARLWPGRLWLAASHHLTGRDRAEIGRRAALAAAAGVPLVAIGDVLYHVPNRRPLQDVLTCIREHTTVETAGFRLEANAERHLKPPAEMARLFHGHEAALAASAEILARARFSLDELAYEYPEEPVPADTSPQAHLEALTWQGAAWRYPEGVPETVRAAVVKELRLIGELDYAQYFLTVHDIVAWARRQRILCQGRGSAANSAVCFCLGITSVDPGKSNLLFERFISKERREPPDIDVDFEHERREEVIQYIYRRYGRERAALTATVICYRPRSAIREVCKALGLSEDIAAALAGTVWGSWGREVSPEHVRAAGLDPQAPEIRRAIILTRQLIGMPRHLSQHVGGFVLTRGRLDETVPIGNAAMAERTFIEWDKDDISALGIMKVDVLALGMLTCIRKAFRLLEAEKGLRLSLATVPDEDPETYAMLSRADSLGVFQVESRAQMNMLPRMKPRTFYDLVIEVAIVRPGPIQGDMVHPYLRRRQGREMVQFPAPAPEHGPPDELQRILGRTLGVPLFQEQAMQIAIDAARFTPDEANGLRRAMATFRRVGTIQHYQDKMVQGMIRRGYAPDFAARCFEQIKGFGEYGFPESHAASFALLVYVSSWLKCHHPEVFACALLNAQPMGFYAPAQIVRDAREHGVEVRGPDLNRSGWDCTLEPGEGGRLALRLGLRMVDGLAEAEAGRLLAARGAGYGAVAEIRGRAGVMRASLERLAAADAFRSMGLDRRAALWAVRGEAKGAALPLFAAAGVAEQGAERAVALPEMPLSEHVVQDFQTLRLSLKAHPMQFLRAHYAAERLASAAAAVAAPNGARVGLAGVVLVRQKPGSAKGVVFVTVEDETGIANIVVWKRVAARFRPVLMGARLLEIRGRVQRAEGVTHVVAEYLADRTGDLARLSEDAVQGIGGNGLAHADEVRRPIEEDPRTRLPARSPRAHPRDVRIIPKSRDFH